MKKNVTVIDLATQRKKKEIIAKINKIPPLPASAQEVLAIVAENPKDVKRLEQVIMHDPSLSSQLLKVANCAAYYPATRITTVHRAIVFLGFAEVKSLALSLSISSVFKNKNSQTGFDRQKFWEHSIAAAMICRILANEMELEETDVYFTCGLLHDLGRIVMDTYFPNEWSQILNYAQENECSLITAERKFGFPHNVIGAWLVKNWELPEIYAKSIASHHIPPGHPHFNKDGALTQLADGLSHELGTGLFKAPSYNDVTIANYLGFGNEKLNFLQKQIEKLAQIAEAIAMGMI